MIVVANLFSYHIEILIKNLTTYQDIKLSSLEIEEKKLSFLFQMRNESNINFESKSKYFFYLFKKKILFRIKKAFFIPYEYYRTESNENIEFLQTAVAVINNNQNNIGNNYNSVPSSALSNEIFDVKINANIKNKIISGSNKEKNSEDTKDKNLNVNFPCNQIKELITNNYNFNTNSNSYSNSDLNNKNNNKIASHGNINTKSVSLSQSNSRGMALSNKNEENLMNIDNFDVKVSDYDNKNNKHNNNKLNYIIKKMPDNHQRVSKNMQKRMNQYLLNHNILNFENIFKDNSLNKDKNNIGYLNTANRKNYSSIYSTNLNENNIHLGEIHLSEREKNNLNHVLKEMNQFNNDNKDQVSNENNKIIQRYLNNNYSKKINPSPDSAQKNQNKSHQNFYNYEKVKNFNFGENMQNKDFNHDFEKNKNVPRHFRINSNINNLNKKHRKMNSKQTGDSITIINDNIIDSNRKTALENIINNKDYNHKNIKNKEEITISNKKDKAINNFDVENDSKKSLNDKIISIINSSGTADDIDSSENGIKIF